MATVHYHAPPMASRQDHDTFHLALATPRKLPKPDRLPGRVVVLDIAFASESGGRRKSFEKTTLPFIDTLGPRLAAWIDHHDSVHHARFSGDDRFVLATKAEHGACPEMVTPELVNRIGKVDTIVCHNDFDGLASAAKWMRGGHESYDACDDDARAIDTRSGMPSPTGRRFDRALRARPRDDTLCRHIVGHLADGLRDASAWTLIDEAAEEIIPLERRSEQLAKNYVLLSDDLALVDVSNNDQPYDRTLLLLLGQQRATMAAVVDSENVTFAAPYDSGVNFVERFGLSGGMPTCLSLHRAKLPEALASLGLPPAKVAPSVES